MEFSPNIIRILSSLTLRYVWLTKLTILYFVVSYGVAIIVWNAVVYAGTYT